MEVESRIRLGVDTVMQSFVDDDDDGINFYTECMYTCVDSGKGRRKNFFLKRGHNTGQDYIAKENA